MFHLNAYQTRISRINMDMYRYKAEGIRCKVGFGFQVSGCGLRVAGLPSNRRPPTSVAPYYLLLTPYWLLHLRPLTTDFWPQTSVALRFSNSEILIYFDAY